MTGHTACDRSGIGPETGADQRDNMFFDRVILIVVSGALVAAHHGCAPIEDLPAPDQSLGTIELDRVILLDTERLESAAVGTQPAFKPGFIQDIDPQDPALGQAAGFFLTVAVASVERLKVRVTSDAASTTSDLVQASPPTSPWELSLAGEPRAFNANVRGQLASGAGIYWLAGSSEVDATLEHRIAVLLPTELLGPFARISIFVQELNGTPVGVAEIELVSDFFYVAIIGDSILWGNGLRERDKMTALVADAIESELQQKVVLQRYAQSSARIAAIEGEHASRYNGFGEVPRNPRSIWAQVDLIERPDLVDLVLMSGCFNDVGMYTILDPFADHGELAELTAEACEVEMEALLRKVRTVAPEAHVVVTGYYPIVGPGSDPLGVQEWANVQGIDSPSIMTGFVQNLTGNSNVFHETAHAGLTSAVDRVNGEISGDPLIAFANPDFGPEHAVFTADPWLWGMTRRNESFGSLDFELDVFPEDPLAPLRLDACAEVYGILDLVTCIFASVGHPNPSGSRVYADAIIADLRDLGVLPR